MYINENLNKNEHYSSSMEDLLNLCFEKNELTNAEYIISLMKELPASSRGYHGSYKGGLYDHTLLVSNICETLFSTFIDYNIIQIFKKEIDKEINVKNAIKACILHDFGKVDSYTEKFNQNFEFSSIEKDRKRTRFYIQKDYKVFGKDDHVERCFCVMKKAEIYAVPVVQEAIIFHHGGWSGFKSRRVTNPLCSLIHSCDLIASGFYKI